MSKSERHLYEFGDFRLDASERLLSRSGVAVPLTPKAIDLLLALVAQPGRLLDKDTLLKTVWPGTFVEENNLADNIFKLRRVLGDGENGSRFIETVPKRGYRFVADVRAIEWLTDQIPDPAPQVVAEPSRHAAGGEGRSRCPPPAPIAARLGTVQGANLSYRRRNFTASDNGLLIYDPHIDRQRSQLLWVDRHGTPLHVLAQLDDVGVPVLSPDESRIVVARKDLATNNNDLWLTDPLGDNPVKFTFDPGSDLLGLWSPDGQRIVWTSTRNGALTYTRRR